MHQRDEADLCAAGTPLVVVRPRDTEQVVAVVQAAARHGVPVVPQGARTGLAGAANAVDGAVVLSTVAMDRILEIDPVNRIAVVQPGVVNAALAGAVGRTGPLLPAGPRLLGVLHDRRQRGHQRRRHVLRQVRRDHRVRARPGGGARLRRGAAHRPAYRQGRRRLRPDPAVRRLGGHPRRDHRDHRGAAPGRRRSR